MLNIKNPEADELARRLARITGSTITDAVIHALQGQLRREEGRHAAPSLADDLMEIGRRCAALPVIDGRTEDEILGYNEVGAWS
jgi:antitoxin VapB